MDDLLLEENNEDETSAIQEEDEKDEAGMSSPSGTNKSAGGASYMLRKTNVGIEISSLEENQATIMQGITRTKTSTISQEEKRTRFNPKELT